MSRQRLHAAAALVCALGFTACVTAIADDAASNVEAAVPSESSVSTAPATSSVPTAAAGSASQNTFDRKKEDLVKLPKPTDLRPTGPITVTAKRAELVQGSSAVYVGNVVMDSDTIKMDGDRLEVKQHPGGAYEAKVTGNPGHLSHAGKGPDDPSVAAHAKTMNYDSATGVVDLIGDAFFKRGDDQITSDSIRYNLTEGRIQASGGDSGQVRLVLPPAPANPPPAVTAPTQTPDGR